MQLQHGSKNSLPSQQSRPISPEYNYTLELTNMRFRIRVGFPSWGKWALLLFFLFNRLLDGRPGFRVDVRELDAVQKSIGLGREPLGPGDFAVTAHVRAIGEIERKVSPVAFREGLAGPDKHPACADIFGQERPRLVLEFSLDADGEHGAVGLSRRDIEELMHFDVQEGKVDGLGEDRVGIAPSPAHPVFEGVRGDDDGGDALQLVVVPDSAEELLARDAGQVEPGDDEVYLFPPVDLQHLVVGGRGEHLNVRQAEKAALLYEKAFNLFCQQHLFHGRHPDSAVTAIPVRQAIAWPRRRNPWRSESWQAPAGRSRPSAWHSRRLPCVRRPH